MTSEQRRLAAILVADVVGYSTRVGSDEAGTLARLNALRSEVIDPALAKHSGRLFKSVGDGFLVEFASAVQAVACAKAIQEANAGGRLPLRIGIHVGDVVVQGDDLMGDGVNIAARIEGVADVGGIAISRAVHEQVRDKFDVSFVDKGEVVLKNLARPVQVFALGGTGPISISERAPPLALPDKPSIAVLPFQNMSGDPEQEYFADGIVEDIITALSRFKSLFVIARNSSFTYKGKPVDIKQVGRELGVRYVLEGSVRRGGNRVRVTGQLIDGVTGTHLWADRFEGGLEDIFELQDRITARVIGHIAPKIEQTEIERAKRKPTANLGAHDFYLRGLAAYQLCTRDSLREAMAFFKRAVELDPAYVSAFGMILACHAFRGTVGPGAASETASVGEVAELVRMAVRIGNEDAHALANAATAVAFVLRDLAAAREHADRSIALNSNLEVAWTVSGWIHLWSGNPSLCIEHLNHAMRLDPLVSASRQAGMAHAHFFLGDHDEALASAESLLRESPEAHGALRIGAAAAGFAGKGELAHVLAARLSAVDPDFRVSRLEEHLGPYRLPAFVEKYKEGLRLAGLPE